jgi:hypothetical protein
MLVEIYSGYFSHIIVYKYSMTDTKSTIQNQNFDSTIKFCENKLRECMFCLMSNVHTKPLDNLYFITMLVFIKSFTEAEIQDIVHTDYKFKDEIQKSQVLGLLHFNTMARQNELNAKENTFYLFDFLTQVFPFLNEHASCSETLKIINSNTLLRVLTTLNTFTFDVMMSYAMNYALIKFSHDITPKPRLSSIYDKKYDDISILRTTCIKILTMWK